MAPIPAVLQTDAGRVTVNVTDIVTPTDVERGLSQTDINTSRRPESSHCFLSICSLLFWSTTKHLHLPSRQYTPRPDDE